MRARAINIRSLGKEIGHDSSASQVCSGFGKEFRSVREASGPVEKGIAFAGH
jgi:hypothetical protein